MGELRILGSRVYIGDAWAIRAEAIAVPVTPGTYEFDVECFSYGADERVAVLRGRLQGAVPDGSRDASEFTVDAASAGVIDADAVDRWAERDGAAFETWQRRFTDSASDIGLFPCEAIDRPWSPSTGLGDGATAWCRAPGERPGASRRIPREAGLLEGSAPAPPLAPSHEVFQRAATIVLRRPPCSPCGRRDDGVFGGRSRSVRVFYACVCLRRPHDRPGRAPRAAIRTTRSRCLSRVDALR